MKEITTRLYCLESFKVITPSPILAPYVQRYWILESASVSGLPQRIIPNGCIELMFNRGDNMTFGSDHNIHPDSFIKGLRTNYYELIPKRNIHLISVCFTPLGAKTFFSIPLAEFNGKSIDALTLGDPLLADLSKRIADTTHEKLCIDYIEQFLLQRFQPLKDYNQKRISTTIHAINHQVEVNITSLADMCCVSYRQFIRIFTEHIGLNPKEYLRIVRFQRSLSVLQHQPDASFTDVAYRCGYYDQPHFINEFKAFTGSTPTEYLQICQPRSDYFS